jgi:hypothetical protein
LHQGIAGVVPQVPYLRGGSGLVHTEEVTDVVSLEKAGRDGDFLGSPDVSVDIVSLRGGIGSVLPTEVRAAGALFIVLACACTRLLLYAVAEISCNTVGERVLVLDRVLVVRLLGGGWGAYCRRCLLAERRVPSGLVGYGITSSKAGRAVPRLDVACNADAVVAGLSSHRRMRSNPRFLHSPQIYTSAMFCRVC